MGQNKVKKNSLKCVWYLETHDEDTECVQDSQADFRGDVGLQQGLIQHVSV